MVWRPAVEPSMSRIEADWQSITPLRNPLKQWVKTGAWGLGLTNILSCLTGTSERESYAVIGSEKSVMRLWGEDLLSLASRGSFFGKSDSSNEELNKSRVMFKGPPGADSEAVAIGLFPGAELTPCPTFHDAFQAVDEGKASRAVLPCEDSVGGTVFEVYDCLAKYSDVQIVAESAHNVEHSLVGLPGAKVEDIKTVYCHPQARLHCSKFLSSLGVDVLSCEDATEGARLIHAKNLAHCGTISTQHMARTLDLQILACCVQDSKSSATRYAVISKAKAKEDDNNNDGDDTVKSKCEFKTSFAVGLQREGSLNSVLNVLTANGIEIDNVVSHPAPQDHQEQDSPKMFSRMFFLDIIGDVTEPLCKLTLHRLQQSTSFLRVLGSYPRDIRV